MGKHTLVLFGMSLLWASGWIAAPMLAQAAAPFAASSLVFALAALSLFCMRPCRPALPLRTNLVLSSTLFTLPTALLLLAGQHGVGGWTPLLYSFMPLLLAFAGEGWTPAMIAAPGAVLVLLNGTVPFTTEKLLWAVPVLAAVGLQAWSLRYAAAHLPGRAVGRSLAAQLAVAAALLACMSLLLDPRPLVGGLASSVSAALVGLALLGTAVPYAGLFFLLQQGRLRPEQIAVAQWLQTLFAVGESAFFVRAHPSTAVYAAAGALLVCTYAVLRRSDAFFA